MKTLKSLWHIIKSPKVLAIIKFGTATMIAVKEFNELRDLIKRQKEHEKFLDNKEELDA